MGGSQTWFGRWRVTVLRCSASRAISVTKQINVEGEEGSGEAKGIVG
jgi:hypothetical protein